MRLDMLSSMPKSKEVDAWFARYDNPMKDVVQRMREIILAADPRMRECIKWQAPTFTFEGNLASFFPKAKQHASLMFHQGAKIPGKHPRLVGGGGTGRMMKIASVAEANAAKADLIRVVKAWCDWRAGESTRPTRSSKRAKSTPAIKTKVEARAQSARRKRRSVKR
jgi:hypothetical protein